MRKLSILGALLGLGLFVWLLNKSGLTEVWTHLIEVGWSGLIVIPLSMLYMLPNTQAWACAFRGRSANVPFWTLFKARTIGEAINYAVPSGYMGGEPVKALLLRPAVPFGEAAGSIVVAKTTQTLALLILILAGLAVMLLRFPMPPTIQQAAVGVPLLLGIGSAVLIWASATGALGKIVRRLARNKTDSSWLATGASKAAEIDLALSKFYRSHKRRLLASTLWHLVGWLSGTIELYVLIRITGVPISLPEAFVLDCLATLVTTGAFFIPASLGAYEGGHYLGALVIGLPPEAGVSLSLLRRVRLLFWTFVGFGFIASRKELLRTIFMKSPSEKDKRTISEEPINAEQGT